MWIYNSNFGKWSSSSDTLSKNSFDLLKQELSATRFYSRVLSGATFLPINNLDDIYDILGEWEPRSWYVSTAGSIYSDTTVPPRFARAIDSDTSYEYYTKFISEYGMTLKNLFTADRLIKDSVKNYYHVDVATTGSIDLFSPILEIDGVMLKKDHKVLVKNQTTQETLLTDIDPETYFMGSYSTVESIGGSTTYEYKNSENGIYIYDGSKLKRDRFLDDYSNCVRYSVYVGMGTVNAAKQYHLKRLNSGYYPTTLNSDPIEFVEKHNWLLRNRVDYNNLFEINYYDVIKHGTQSYQIEGVTYSIPARTLAVGEFGVILNTQNLSGQQGTSNIIANKYKVNLRSITQTSMHYWIAGDESVLLKVRKHDFFVEKIVVDTLSNLTSVAFYNDLRGAAVGELNTILITTDGGQKWDRLRIADFAPYTYNKLIFTDANRFYIGGRNGVFLELFEDVTGWTAFKRRIFKEIDDDDEYLLVDGINDLYKTTINSWGLSYSFGSTQSTATDKELVFIAANDGNIVVYDTKDATDFDFLYLDFGKKYGDIRNITRQSGTNNFYFTADDGLYRFDISDFKYIGVGNTYSNTIAGTYATLVTDLYANEIFDYEENELLICGNNSLLRTATYSSSMSFDLLDEEFESRLKSKLLFMDYDIGAKLNWFTDQGDYRLPNSVTFSAIGAIRRGGRWNQIRLNEIGFSPLVYGATAPSMATQSEVTWYTYWIDDLKTFEYYSEYPLNEYEVSGYTSSMVLISTTFSYGGDSVVPPNINYSGPSYVSNQIKIYDTRISNSYSDIISLAPSFAYGGSQSSRYDKLNRPAISETPQIAADIQLDKIKLYLYDYLMILRLPKYNNANFISSGRYKANVGDVYRLESPIAEGNFVVNKIWESANARYLYMYSEFNQSIITDLVQNAGTSASPNITLTNLNVYSTIPELVDNFAKHPMGLAYDMKIYASASRYSEYQLMLSPKFNNLTSYYNLATYFHHNELEISTVLNQPGTYLANLDTYYKEMVYTGGFLKFGYTPTYNLLDYMESINKYSQVAPIFYASKEYLALPVYKDIPLGSLSFDNAYIDSSGITQSGTTGNRILFGEGLKLEWQSIMENTFVDVSIYQPTAGGTFDTNRLLVMNKYKVENIDGLGISAYVIEFHKKLNFSLGVDFEGGSIDIKSRRTLQQISDDLQELNNIHRARLDVNYISNDTFGYRNYQRELNFKIPTDSYAKAFLSDSDTVESLSAIIYIDYKHELSMNITKLDVAFNVPIGNTADFNGQLFITCAEKHGLSKGDSVVLDFDGGEDSSQYLNQNYLGYRVVTEVYGEYDFTVDLPYGNEVYVGADTGYARYVKRDPFLNYQPIDIIDIGLDKKGKIAIELSPENLVLEGKKFSLKNVDFNKYRFRLIDGMNIEIISVSYPWILEAEISGAVIGLDSQNSLLWYKGIWEGGRWFGGTWISGTWKYGDWYAGTWNSKTIKDRGLKIEIDEKSSDPFQSTWFTGRWFDGTWNNGTWANGRFYAGTWNDGVWNNGIWNDGTWNNGRFIGGIWVDGKWNNGLFNTDNEPAYWIDGEWTGGDFENGMWYNGSFETKTAPSRFGTKAYNSRTATWHGGKWLSGSFYSKLGAASGPSEVHKYSIWYTGQWMSGDFYGGVAYNMDFKSGTWHGGILEDIQIIGMDENNNSFILNGIFKFNIGDEFYIIDNESGTEISAFGSNSDPKRYTVLYTVEDSVNKFTEVYVATNISDFSGRYLSYKMPSGPVGLTIGTNSYGTNSIYVSGAQENIKDVKVKINLSAANLVVEKAVPVAQYRTGVSGWYTGYPFGTSASSILQSSPGVPGQPIGTQQTSFLSQNIIGVRLSDSDGKAKFHWAMSPLNYSGPGFNPVVYNPISYVQNGTMVSLYGDQYVPQNKVLDPITRDVATFSYVPTGTAYFLDDEIYSYAIDISEDPSFGTFFGAYSSFDAGMTYSYEALDLNPDTYYYFRVSEVRSSGIGSLKIKLKSPGGNAAEVKAYNKGNTDTDMIGTILTYAQDNPDIDTGAPIYRGTYKMGLEVSGAMAPGWTGTSSNLLIYPVGMTDSNDVFHPAGSTASDGYWTLYVENTSGVNLAVLEDWEIQFGYSDHIGAKLGDRTPAFDTGLRAVSRFRNANWKTGIWTNGFFEDGLFEAGIWYNGIFNGTWS
jgi:hypothetical protein